MRIHLLALCPELLGRVGKGDLEEDIIGVLAASKGIAAVRNAKVNVVQNLHRYKRKEQVWVENFVDLEKRMNSSLFLCLTALMRVFMDDEYDINYPSMKEGTDSVYIVHCIEIIEQALV